MNPQKPHFIGVPPQRPPTIHSINPGAAYICASNSIGVSPPKLIQTGPYHQPFPQLTSQQLQYQHQQQLYHQNQAPTLLMQRQPSGTRLTCRPLPLVLARKVDTNRLVIMQCSTDAAPLDILRESHRNVMVSFGQTKVHPDRIIYAIAGTLFYPWSPLPFGGPKTCPGYTSFDGSDAMELLKYILTESFQVHWQCKGRESLDFVVGCINEVLTLHYQGDKEELDERMLKGMKKAGHIQWQGQNIIPAYLSHIDEGTGTSTNSTVEFTPIHLVNYRRAQVKRRQQSIEEAARQDPGVGVEEV
ncbi:hypothetical protein BDR26DRAFT_858853 [Obelidium mucronatum]|nr:hypothetical protein BDR26DRAFT_858853 [Obelidium mucronatum]